MRDPESSAELPAASARPLARRLPLHRRLRWRAAAIVVVAAAGAAAAAIAASAERDAYLRTHPPVPGLVGKTVAEAARTVWPLHFGVLVTASYQDPNAVAGVVLAQNPAPGRRVPVGWVIQLKVSQGSGVVPHLRGAPVHKAAQRLEGVGLRLGRVTGIEDDAPPGTVLEQFAPPGHRLDFNSPVDVLTSQGPQPVASQPAAKASSPVAPSAGLSPAPAAAAQAVDPQPAATVWSPERRKPDPPQRGEEGGSSVGSASTDCAVHPERERAKVCPQPEDNGGTEPDLHRSEHGGIPSSP